MATTGLYSQHLNNRKKLHARNAVIALLLVLFAVLALFPIFYMIMSSFGPAIATAGNTRSIFPSKWTLDSYKAFFDFSKYSGRWILNSLIVATATVVGNVIFASMAGYAFSKINFKGRKWMFAMILVAMMIPYQVTQVPLYILIANKLKMTNTYAALILPGVVTSYNIFLAVILILFAVLTLFPIFYMIMSSFGPAVATAGTSRSIFPRVWTLDSYKAFFEFSKYSVRWIENSLIVATATVIGNVIFASMAGYAFSKIRFKGRQWLFGLILVAMMIPYQVTQVPLYILIANKLHMTNTYAAMILPGVVTSYNIFLAKQFFTSIPTPLIESAKLDGCNQLGIFIRIILPLSKTVLAVMAINTFLSSWNTFFWPFLVTSKDYMFTIQVGLKTFKFANETLFAPMMAGATLSALPMFLLFFTLQKYFLEGVTIGAVKG